MTALDGTLHYTYGPSGREAIAYHCPHGDTELRGLALYAVPEGFTSLLMRHRDRTGCLCDPGRMIRTWADARVALAQFEAMAADVPPGVDELDVSVMLTDLVDLRAAVPCPGCTVSWTAIAEAGGRLSRQFFHDPECPDLAERARKGELRGMHSTISRARPS